MNKEQFLRNITQLNDMISFMENVIQDGDLTKEVVKNLKTIKSRQRLNYYKQFRKTNRSDVVQYFKNKQLEILSLQLNITDDLEISYFVKTNEGEQFITEETLTNYK